MGTAIKHPVPDRVKPLFVILTSGHSGAQSWASECPGVKNYKSRLNPVWHRMLYSCTHMATVGFKGLNIFLRLVTRDRLSSPSVSLSDNVTSYHIVSYRVYVIIIVSLYSIMIRYDDA